MLDLIQEATASTQLVISLPIVDVDAGTAVETSSISVTSRNLQDLGIWDSATWKMYCITV